jgi:hypothetical protein
MTTFVPDTRERNRELAQRLLELTEGVRTEPVLREADAIVTHIEVNDHHGVGVLVNRLFGQSDNVLSIRSKDAYNGKQQFGTTHVCISHVAAPRDMVFWKVLEALRGATVNRVLCVPYFPDDALTAIALTNIFDAQLCTYLMDDQNLCADGIPDSVIAELLNTSSLRLAISPELCAGYEEKYGQKMWFMPPLVPGLSIPTRLNQPSEAILQSKSGVIVGNIWGQRWSELLRETVRHSGTTLRWYNNGEFPWLACSKEELARDGVIPQEGVRHTDEKLIEILRDAPFVVVPSGTLDETDDRYFIAKLSLPSRIPFTFATSHAPLLVLGSAETAAARFVTEVGIGLVAPYERRAFQEAVDRITDPDQNNAMRRAAFRLSHCFTDQGAADWIWRSLANGEPIDRRYEELMPRQEPAHSISRESPRAQGMATWCS